MPEPNTKPVSILQEANSELVLDSALARRYRIGMAREDPKYAGARRLAALMAERRLSQHRLARESGVHQPKLSLFLKPPEDPDWSPLSEGNAAKLGRYFKVPPATFRAQAGSIDEILVDADPEDVEAVRRHALAVAKPSRR